KRTAAVPIATIARTLPRKCLCLLLIVMLLVRAGAKNFVHYQLPHTTQEKQIIQSKIEGCRGKGFNRMVAGEAGCPHVGFYTPLAYLPLAGSVVAPSFCKSNPVTIARGIAFLLCSRKICFWRNLCWGTE